MRLNDQAGTVIEVGRGLQGRLARKEKLAFLGGQGCRLTEYHPRLGLVAAELLLNQGAYFLHLGNTVFGGHLNGEGQVRRKRSC